MPIFPKLSSGVVAKYPTTRRHNWRTGRIIFTDMSEQRWAKGQPFEEFDLEFQNVGGVDKETLRNFFNSVKGPFDTTWEFDFPDPPAPASPGQFLHMKFAKDSTFTAVENKPGRWAVTLRVQQTRPV